MLTLFAGRDEPVERFTELDTERYATLFRGLLERDVYVAPSQYECLFPHSLTATSRSTRRSRR